MFGLNIWSIFFFSFSSSFFWLSLTFDHFRLFTSLKRWLIPVPSSQPAPGTVLAKMFRSLYMLIRKKKYSETTCKKYFSSCLCESKLVGCTASVFPSQHFLESRCLRRGIHSAEKTVSMLGRLVNLTKPVSHLPYNKDSQ